MVGNGTRSRTQSGSVLSGAGSPDRLLCLPDGLEFRLPFLNGVEIGWWNEVELGHGKITLPLADPPVIRADVGVFMKVGGKMRFEGIYTPLVTPWNGDFSLNVISLAETVEFLIDAGVDGIIVAGTTGEYYAQSAEERIDMMGRVRKLIAGRLPMIVGTGAMRTEESVMFAKAAKAAGADALLVATPPYT